jgi:hypothetical protein
MAAKKQQKDETPEWQGRKDGGYYHPKTGWFATPYMTGWYFYTKIAENHGPYKTFEDGLKEWKKFSK